MAVLRVTFPIPPGLLAANRRDQIGYRQTRNGRKPVIVKADAWAAAQDELILAVRQACVLQRWRTWGSRRVAYVVAESFWPEDKGDHDAPAKAICDALQAGGAIENDDQITHGLYLRTWGDARPRIEIALATEWGDFLELVPW